MGTLKSGSGKSRRGKCGTIWQVPDGRPSLQYATVNQAIGQWGQRLYACEFVIKEEISNCCYNIAFDYFLLLQ